MKRPQAHRVIPGVVMAAAATVPVITAADMLAHAGQAGASGVLTIAQPALAAPTSTPVPTATSEPKSTTPKAASTSTATPAPTSTPAAQTFVGPVVYDQYGGVQATITVAGKKISNVSISAPRNDPRSANINAQAVPMLVSETLQAQSASMNAISGATETSDAYIQSLQGALQRAGIG